MNIRRMLGLPDLLDVKKVLAVQPHPDDNEIHIAGTLMELAKRGCEIVYITVTDGRAGATAVGVNPQELTVIREQEKNDAGKIIGVSKFIDLGFRDGGKYSTEEVAKELVYIFRKETPDLVFTADPWLPYEAHPDHIKVGMATAQALLFSKNPVLYPTDHDACLYQVPQVAFYATAYPNEFVTITGHLEKKLQSIFAHESQFANEKWELMKQYFIFEARRMYAIKYGGKTEGYAEGVKVLATEQLHSFPSTIFT